MKSNIIIQGDDQSVSTKFGGRILISQTLYEGDILYGQLKLSGMQEDNKHLHIHLINRK